MSEDIRYLIVRDANGRVQFAGRGVVEYPDADEPEVRQDKVDAVKAQIAAGNYVTLGKLEMAADGLAAEISGKPPKPANLLSLVEACAPHKKGVDGRCLRCGIVVL